MAQLVGRLRPVGPVQLPQVRPFLKWAGGKQWLAQVAAQLLPNNFDGKYYEPFLGGGAFFFAIRPGRSSLSDVNTLLVDTYVAIRDDVEKVIDVLRTYRYDEGVYARLRTQRPRTAHTAAARLIYLNRASFNGLYRVNAKGEFNVPFGRFENPTICDTDRLRAIATALTNASLRASDFGRALGMAREGDFAYLDPPYVSAHTSNGFIKYNASLFSWADQARLAELASRAAKRGVAVLLSNAHHDSILRLYKGFDAYLCSRRSAVGVASSRGHVTEILLANYSLRDEVIES